MPNTSKTRGKSKNNVSRPLFTLALASPFLVAIEGIYLASNYDDANFYACSLLLLVMCAVVMAAVLAHRNEPNARQNNAARFTISMGISLAVVITMDYWLYTDITHTTKNIVKEMTAKNLFDSKRITVNTASVPITVLKSDIRNDLGGPNTLGSQLVLQDELVLQYHMPYFLLNSILWQGRYLNLLENADLLHTIPAQMRIQNYPNIPSVYAIQNIKKITYKTYTEMASSDKLQYRLASDYAYYAAKVHNGILTSGFVPLHTLLAYQKMCKEFSLPPFNFNRWLAKNSGNRGAMAAFAKLTASLDTQNECIVKLGSMCPSAPHLAGH